MKFEDVKSLIEEGKIGDSLLILQYQDNNYVAYQWAREIARIHNKSISYLDSLEGIVSASIDIFGTQTIDDGERIFRCDNFDITSDKLKFEKNLIIITNKIFKESEGVFKDNICVLPKLEEWHIKDYVYSLCDGIDEKELEWFVNVCNSDIYRISNEIDKICLFSPNERKYLFEDMKYQGAFSDLSTFNVFNITNAVTNRDYNALLNALREIKNFDAEPLGVVTLLYQGFRKLILVWLASNPTPENTGLKSNVIYAINKSPRTFTKKQLLDAYQFLNSIDKLLKTGQLCDMNKLIDYIICKVLTF